MSASSLTAIACLCMLLIACDQPTPTQNTEPVADKAIVATVSDASAMLSGGSEALLKSHSRAQKLRTAISNFLAQVSPENLQIAQQQWHLLAITYREFMFCEHIGLVAPTHFATLNRLDYQIASYPIQPGFLDKFGDYQYSGLVHDISFPLSTENLKDHHGLTDLSELVLGIYAIEFMLFDRDIADYAAIMTISEELKDRGFTRLAEIPNNRRRELLQQQAAILVDDLVALQMLWNKDEATSVSTTWRQLSSVESLEISKKALLSAITNLMIEVGELNSKGGENQSVSPQISAGSFSLHQEFIGNGLHSLPPGLAQIEKSLADKIRPTIQAAIELTEIETVAENDHKTHWKKVFEQLRDASNILTSP